MPPLAKVAPKKRDEQYQERDIVRILINFGDRALDEETSVAEFILLDMLDLLDEFDQAICSKIVREYLTQLQQDELPSAKHFITHPDPEIAKMAVDMVATLQEHDFSEGWEKLNVFLNTQEIPERNHIADAQSGILRFKLKKIERLIRKNQLELKTVQEADNMADVMLCLKINQKLQGMKMTLAKQLNTVVLR